MRRIVRNPSPEGKLLYKLRIRADMTQDELGRLVGVTASVISRWETGDIRVSQRMISTVCSALQVDDETLQLVLEAAQRPWELSRTSPPPREPELLPVVTPEVPASVFSDAG